MNEKQLGFSFMRAANRKYPSDKHKKNRQIGASLKEKIVCHHTPI